MTCDQFLQAYCEAYRRHLDRELAAGCLSMPQVVAGNINKRNDGRRYWRKHRARLRLCPDPRLWSSWQA